MTEKTMLEAGHSGVLQARRRLLETGDIRQDSLSPQIQRSWQRCISRGLDLIGRPHSEPMTAREFSRVIERNERLRRIARPELEALGADGETAGSIAILTDATGIILDTVGDTSFADKAARVSLMPGVRWDEQANGTNAIGSALAEGESVSVLGAEHFFEPHRMLACAATPIRSPDGELIGVLDISGPATTQHLHALGLVRMAVDQIEHRMFANGFEACNVLRLHRDRACLGTAREAILVFEADRLIAANRHGLTLVGLDWNRARQARYNELFATPLSAFADKGELRQQNGSLVFGQLQGASGAGSVLAHSPCCKAERPESIEGVQAAQLPNGQDPIFCDSTLAALVKANRLAQADIPILIQGETGTGKEVFARACHNRGTRSTKPFVAVNCAALPESLIESELFGYEDGAFTGARKQGTKGYLRAADGGTLFLDEIGDMPLSAQARLLRVLQEREVTPLGGQKPIPVNFTLICATHRDLSRAVAAGEFRADLYFRIAQYVVALPAVRNLPDRQHLIERLLEEIGGKAMGIQLSRQALTCLVAYSWPGNFRQLTGTLRALVALADPGDIIGHEALPVDVRLANTPRPLAQDHTAHASRLADLENQAMRAALVAAKGNVSLAAKRLGVHRSTFYRKGIDRVS